MRQIADIDGQIAELTTDPAWEQLGQVADEVQAVEDYLGSVIGDITSTREGIEEKIEDFSAVGEQVEELFEIPEVKEFVEGVQGGLESTENILGEIKGGVEKFNEFVQTLELGEGLTSGDAQEQLEAAAKAFEVIVDKLGPLVDKIPVLGAFIQIWGLGITRAAEVAGVLTETVQSHNDLYASIRPGAYLYLTDEALADAKLTALKLKRADLLDRALNAATNEREESEAADLETTATDRDIAVETAIRRSSDAKPVAMTPVYREWMDSSKNLAEAKNQYHRATAQLDGLKDEAAKASVRAETYTGNDTKLADQATSAAGAVERYEPTVEAAKENLESAIERHDAATAAHWDEINGYRDVVKANLIELIPKTNGGKGFTDLDYRWLAVTYPQFAVTKEQVLAGSGAGAVLGGAAAGAVSPSTVSPVGGAVGAAGMSAAGMSAGTKRLVLIGGGAFAGLLLIGSIFVFGGDGTTPGDLKTAPSSNAPTVSESPPDQPADEPTTDEGCDEYGCSDMGLLPSAAPASVTWTDASCSETPASVSGEVELSSGSNGASFVLPGDAPGNRMQIGNGEVTGRGFGGGTITRDGVTTGTTTVLEVDAVSADGFSGSLMTLSGPADDEGNVDPATAECTNGGSFVFAMDPAVWAGWLELPRESRQPVEP